MSPVHKQSKKLVVIDTDPGVDDAQGILMALNAPDVDVIAITVTHGNVSVDQTAENALRVLQVADRMDIPVHRGSEKPLQGERISASFVHGSDGFGDSPDPRAPGLSNVQSEHAVTALLRLANTYRGQLSLVCLGPLTNIALALRLDPEFGRKLKNCYIMGGNYEATGNTPASPCAEFNFLADPEAAHITLTDLHCPITMVCWELCLKYAFTWEWYDQLTSTPTTKGRFVKAIGAKSLDIYFKRGTKEQLPRYETADSMLMAVALSERVVRETRDVYCTVELRGTYTRGQMVLDRDGCLGQRPNVRLVTSLDHPAYGNMLMQAVQ